MLRQVGNAITEVLEEQDRPLTCNLRFQGQYADAESGLHYNRFRYYDPELGRFASQDPVGLSGGLNVFAFAANPTCYIDELGLKPCRLPLVRYRLDKVAPLPGSYTSGINRAWALERRLAQITGFGTVDWTDAQLAELKSTGRVRGFTGHHINNAATAPAWQGDPRNIAFLSNSPNGGDHLRSVQGHRGSWGNATSGRLIDREEMIRQYEKLGDCP